MTASQIVNSLGLVLDIVGVSLLFLFGLPSKVREGGKKRLLLEGADPAAKQQFDRYWYAAWSALWLLIGGFLLQLVSNFL